MNEITAPYNFVPLSGWIFSPPWAKEVSQDIPFEDGLSGHLEIEITAETPILVGKNQKPATQYQPGEVHFYQHGKQYAIPGSSLKGAIRNVLEIASFGKMLYVDDRRLGIRDISGDRVREKNYQMTGQKAGFLRLLQDNSGKAEIIPCEFAHIWHQDMSRYGNLKEPYFFQAGMSVRRKYDEWRSLTDMKSSDELSTLSFDLEKLTPVPKASNVGQGKTTGYIIFTGQISDRNKTPHGGKYRDFVFFNRREYDSIEISPKVLADFRFIHGAEDSQHKGPWNDYWNRKFYQYKEIPVFYQHKAGVVTSIGLAYMYKLAYDHSIGDTISHTHPLHRDADYLDLPEVLFGKVHPDSKKADDSLKGRVSFGLCLAQGSPQEQIELLPQ